MRASPLEEGDILQTGGSVGEPARWQRRVQEFVLGQIGDPPARVLAVCCGAGELARAMARAGHAATALDPRAPEGPILRRAWIPVFHDPRPLHFRGARPSPS